jgi:hypothetical protein
MVIYIGYLSGIIRAIIFLFISIISWSAFAVGDIHDGMGCDSAFEDINLQSSRALDQERDKLGIISDGRGKYSDPQYKLHAIKCANPIIHDNIVYGGLFNSLTNANHITKKYVKSLGNGVNSNNAEVLTYRVSISADGSLVSSYDFGSVALGQSAEKVFTITNIGTGNVTFASGDPSFFTGSGGPYSISDNTCLTGLAPSASCTLKLSFTPTLSGSTGNYLLYRINESSNFYSLLLSGNGVTALTVPEAPISVSAMAGYGQATISWTAPVNTGGSAITGYSVTGSPGGSCTAGPSASSCVASGLTNGTAYTFQVVATNAQGDSPASPASDPVIPLGVPDVPTSVSATAGNAQAVVSFTAPVNNGGSSITGYTTSCTSTDGGAAATVTGSGSPLTVTGLTNGKSYTCIVKAANAQGDSPASTASNSFIPLGVPDVPTSVSATAGNAQVTLNWTAPTNTGGAPITAYTVTGSPGGGCTTTGATACVVTGLTNGTAYTFQVIATTEVGDSLPASSNTVTPSAILAPVIFAVSPSSGSQDGGTPVIITGSNMTGASQVLFDKTPATGVTVNPAGNQITAISPPHAGGAVDVSVITPAGEDTLELSFTYDAPPAVPGTPILAPGDRQVDVSWPQVLTGGGDPVSYTVTATPGGQTCTVPFPGQAFAHASCVVTGLTNGTTYTFKVQATNALGSATSGPSIPATPQAVLNGACGAANGVETLVPPAGLLCGTGTASAVTNANGTFTWSCSGTNGGSTAQCSAPGAASQGAQAGSTAFTSDTATSGCNLNSARLIAPPSGGPGGSTTMPYGVVNFEMVSCSGNEARVRMTYAGIVEGMQFWKYVVNSQHNGWVQRKHPTVPPVTS